MAFDKDRIKNDLTLEQVAEIIEELGGNPSIHGDVIMADTICHNLPGEGSHKLYYYDNTKLLRCYTECHEYFDIYQLIVKAHEVQYEEEWALPKAVAYVAHKFGYSSIEEDGFENILLEDWTYIKDYDRIKEVITKEKKEISLKEYDDKILNCMAHPLIGPWLEEGITKETMDRFEISYYPKECQIVIPHRDVENKLIGIRGRTLVKEEGELFGKYRPLIVNRTMYNHPLGFALYGLNLNKNNISSIRKAIVFEGEKSVMLYDSYFGSDNNISVACCGSSISSHQFELLRELGIQELVIAFDRQFKEIGDKEFKTHTKNLQKLADKYKNYVTVSCMFDKNNYLDYKSSPIDHGKEIFLKMFRERIIL